MIYGYYLKNNTKTLKQQRELIMNYCYIDESNIFYDAYKVKKFGDIEGLQQLIRNINPSSLDTIVLDNIKSLINFGLNKDQNTNDESHLLKYEAIRKLYGFTKLEFVETPEFNSENFFEYVMHNGKYMCLPLNLDDEFKEKYFEIVDKVNKNKIVFYRENKDKIIDEIIHSVTFKVEIDEDGIVHTNEKLDAFKEFRLEMLQEEIDRISKIEYSVVNNTFDFIIYFDDGYEFKIGFNDENLFPIVFNRKQYFKEFKDTVYENEDNEFYLKTMRNYIYLTSSIIKTLIYGHEKHLNELSIKKAEVYQKAASKGAFVKRENTFDKKYVNAYEYIIKHSKKFFGNQKDVEVFEGLVEICGINISDRTYRTIKKELIKRYQGMSYESVLNEIALLKSNKL